MAGSAEVGSSPSTTQRGTPTVANAIEQRSGRSRQMPFKRSNSKLDIIQNVEIISSCHLHVQKCLGKGSFAQVCKVEVTAPITTDDRRHFALKCLNSKLMSPNARRVAALDQSMEADLLSRLNHENIIKLYGVTCSEECNSPACSSHHAHDHCHESRLDAIGHCLVLELLQETLQDRLAAWRRWAKLPNFLQAGLHSRSSMQYRLDSVVMGIAKGMAYLHDNCVFVRDLKPSNIGFDSQGQVKLFDFGLARELHECDGGELVGTLRYMAPEIALSTCPTVTLASDVYSFGVLLWEICTLQKPFAQHSSTSKFKRHVCERNERPSLRSIPLRLIQDLIRRCWDPCPSSRPSLKEVQSVLDTNLAQRRKRHAHVVDWD